MVGTTRCACLVVGYISLGQASENVLMLASTIFYPPNGRLNIKNECPHVSALADPGIDFTSTAKLF